MFAITAKRFWMLVTFSGVLMFIGGLVATVLLTIETGEKRPDSECSSMRAAVLAVCYTSDDPKVLLGVGPMIAGGGMVGIGIWRWTTAASYERAVGDTDEPEPPPPPPPVPAEADNPLEEYEKLRAEANKRTPPKGG